MSLDGDLFAARPQADRRRDAHAFSVWSRVKFNTYLELEEIRSDLPRDGDTRAYNEAAFACFLDLEHRRSERSNRPFTLLLADFAPWSGVDARMEQDIATSVLSVLLRCLRDTDFVGWYLHEQVAGAVLTEGAAIHDENASRNLRERVIRALTVRLPETFANRVRVRVYHQTPGKGLES